MGHGIAAGYGLQTASEAEAFGIAIVTAESDLAIAGMVRFSQQLVRPYFLQNVVRNEHHTCD